MYLTQWITRGGGNGVITDRCDRPYICEVSHAKQALFVIRVQCITQPVPGSDPAALMCVHRLRRWPNIEAALGQRLVIVGNTDDIQARL